MRISKYWKAVVAAVAAGAAALATALDDGTVTAQEGLTVGLAVLGALGLTWAVPNKARTPSTPPGPVPGS
ncbi:hypothetical protein [Streptomyces alboflavus]|uniref:hypothetical protein n=1 Tax=Streptomyces alboflavus TaxID=67267 RepID=UPI0004BEFC51|nr:hypothetical protein [Streptomyces alboflavus]